MIKVLLVEDNEMNRDMLSRRLQRLGYDVLIAENGEEGMRLARDAAPCLILMDVGLPDIDGLEATRRLKADERTRHIPIIVLTAHTMNGDRQLAFEAGGDDYDSKPIELPRLQSKIAALLARGAA